MLWFLLRVMVLDLLMSLMETSVISNSLVVICGEIKTLKAFFSNDISR